MPRPVIHFEIGCRDSEKTQQLGGKTIFPPTDVPGMGQFAWFADPDENTIGFWKPLAQVS